MERSAIIGLAVVFFCRFSLFAEKLVFQTTDSPPFIMMVDGKPSGMDVDVLYEFIAINNLDAEIQVIPWQRALVNARSGEASAVFTLKKNDERMKYLNYPSERLQTERTVIASIAGKGKKIAKLSDLQGIIVGVSRGIAYSNEFDAADYIVKDESVNDVQLITKLLYGRFLYVAGDEIVIKYLAAKEGVQLETQYVLGEFPAYIAFAKTLGTRSLELAMKFDETMRRMVKDGIVKAIHDKYLKVEENKKRQQKVP